MNYVDAVKIAYDVCKVLPNGEQKDVVVYYAIQAAMTAAEQEAEMKKRFNGVSSTKESLMFMPRQIGKSFLHLFLQERLINKKGKK